MGSIYFDITDIVSHAEHHPRVSGIQRVQLRIIANLVRKHGPSAIRGVAHLDGDKGWREIDLAFLANQTEFNALEILVHAGLVKHGLFPDRREVKKYLRRFGDRKLLRATKKLEVYARALFAPHSLAKHGIVHMAAGCSTGSPLKPTGPLKPFTAQDTYVMLGANWTITKTEALALEHKEREGRVVQMIYDLIPYTHPQYHTEKLSTEYCAWLERVRHHTCAFMCISENTARNLTEFLSSRGVRADVAVTALAHEFGGYERNQPLRIQEGSRLSGLVGGRPYVLCVGTLEIRKNGLGLARAWQKVHETLGSATPLLIFAGSRGWRIEKFEEFLEATDHVSQTIKIIQAPSDAELAALYAQSLFTVYPSFYEGWGLPVGESAWFGKYGVVASNSSLPEVCGDDVDYMDPDNIDDMAAKILRPLQDEAYLARKHAAMAARPLRTWADVSDAVFHCIDNRSLRVQTSSVLTPASAPHQIHAQADEPSVAIAPTGQHT